MKHIRIAFAVLLVAGITVCAAVAQPPGGVRGPDGFRPPMHPLEQALDADGDRQLSASEIENAVAALKTLDKNENGKLDEEELRPRFGGRPEGAGRGFGPPDGRPGGPGRDAPGGDRDAGRPASDEEALSRILSFDKNEDGRLTKDELPERMQGMIRNGDANGDGALDKEELAKLTENFRARADSFRGRGEGRPAEGDRPQDRGPEGRGFRGPGAGPDGRGGPPSPEVVVENAMRFDADADGKLSRDELMEFAREMVRFRGGQGGPQGRAGRGPDGDQRPQRPESE